MDAPAPVRWSHVGLNCRDQARTEQFYTRVFGFRRARVVGSGADQVVFLRQGDVYLELFAAGQYESEAAEAAEADGPRRPGVARHLAFQVDDLDAFVAAAGSPLTVSLGPLRFDEFIPGWKTMWVRDPDGVVVEISQGYRDQ